MAILAAAGLALRLDVEAPWAALSDEARSVAMQGAGNRVFDVEWRYQRGTRRGVHAFRTPWIGLLALVRDEYTRKHADKRGAANEPLMMSVPCHACSGGGLRPEALAVRFGDISISGLLARTVSESLAFFADVDAGRNTVEDRLLLATRDVRDDIGRRHEIVIDAVGLLFRWFAGSRLQRRGSTSRHTWSISMLSMQWPLSCRQIDRYVS